MRRVPPFPVLIAVAALVVAGCSAPTAPAASYAAAPCPVPNVAAFPQLNLGPGFTCGFLTVPLRHADPGGPKIKVAVARIKAASAAPKGQADPLLWLTGGPGGTAIATANTIVQEGLNADRDVIFVDQRGTLHSEPKLTCPEIDRFLAASTAESVQAHRTAVEDVAAVRACRERLAAGGTDLAAFNTLENAADLADLRVALGIPRWNVYGVSYGTDLALQLVRDHPEGIGSLVLDSAVPPQRNLVADFWPNAAEGLTATFDACAAQPHCASAYPGPAAEFTRTVSRLAATPLTVGLPADAAGPARTVVLDGYSFANLVVVLSLSAGTYGRLPAMIHAVARGDGAEAARTMAALVTPPDIVGYGLAYGVLCGEQAGYTDRATALAKAKAVFPGLPDAVLALPPQTPRVFDECPVWNVGTVAGPVREPARTDVPSLVLIGGFDAVTPPSWGHEVAAGLSRSQVVTLTGIGHDTVVASECARSVVQDFLRHPETPADATCAAALKAPAFE